MICVVNNIYKKDIDGQWVSWSLKGGAKAMALSLCWRPWQEVDEVAPLVAKPSRAD